jgi:hypothetical protein
MRKVICLVVFVTACPVMGQQTVGDDGFEGPPVPDRLRNRRASRVTGNRRSAQARRSQARRSQVPPDAAQARKEAAAAIQDIHSRAKKLGKWEDQFAVINGATNVMYQRNGWNSETDQFAKELTLEVSRIPPWENQARFNKFIETMGKRYKLDKAQSDRLRSHIAWESVSFFMKHAPEMIEQSREVLDTRGRGNPFSPEQVAKWEKNGRPMLLEWQERLNNISEKMLPHLRPDQIEIARQDLEAWDGRVQELSGMMEHWEQGEWSPADWGLDKADPIHAGLAANDARARPTPPQPQPAQPQPAKPNQPPQPPQAEKPAPRDPLFAVAQDETAWEKYVREFIQRYKLDNSQSTTALGILDQLRDRAGQMREGRADALARLDELIRKADDKDRRASFVSDREDMLSPIRELFDELKDRLDNLLTDAQRGGGAAAAAG